MIFFSVSQIAIKSPVHKLLRLQKLYLEILHKAEIREHTGPEQVLLLLSREYYSLLATKPNIHLSGLARSIQRRCQCQQKPREVINLMGSSFVCALQSV